MKKKIKNPIGKSGDLCEPPPMGKCTRRLQHKRRCVGIYWSRYGGSVDLPLGRRRYRGNLWRETAIMFCFSFWNKMTAELRERFFGLSNYQGNHGEDIKEIFYYLDNTPSHSYMKMVYKYPINAFPYDDLINTECATLQKKTLNMKKFDTASLTTMNIWHFHWICKKLARMIS